MRISDRHSKILFWVPFEIATQGGRVETGHCGNLLQRLIAFEVVGQVAIDLVYRVVLILTYKVTAPLFAREQFIIIHTAQYFQYPKKCVETFYTAPPVRKIPRTVHPVERR